MNNRQEKPPLKCLLGIDPEKAQKFVVNGIPAEQINGNKE